MCVFEKGGKNEPDSYQGPFCYFSNHSLTIISFSLRKVSHICLGCKFSHFMKILSKPHAPIMRN